MRIAILSCGPSLAHVTPEDLQGFDRIIGVNEAALRLPPCDWLSCGDASRLLAMRDKSGTQQLMDTLPPRILMIDNDIDRVRDSAPSLFEAFGFKGWNELRGELPGEIPSGWDTYSSTAALALAASLGASNVVCFGVDMIGVTDVAGIQTPERNDERWAREQKIWNDLVEWMGRARGVTVMRFLKTPGDGEPINEDQSESEQAPAE